MTAKAKGEIILRPIKREYIHSLRGKGLVKTPMAEKKSEKERNGLIEFAMLALRSSPVAAARLRRSGREYSACRSIRQDFSLFIR